MHTSQEPDPTADGRPSAPDPATASTFAYEDTLPRVPLPTLDESCQRFLDWCAPLLSAREREATEAEVAAFAAEGGVGRTLQAALAEYDASEGVHSWLDTFWPYRYLGRRDRIALNANFFFLFQDVAFQDTARPQVERAAGLVAGALRYKAELDRERVPPLLQRGQPQTMEQHRYLFGTTRIPGLEQDTVRAPYTAERPGPCRARHIVVFSHGTAFRLDVLGPDGTPHSLADLAEALRAVLAAGAEPAAPGTSVGHLTTLARAEWATARTTLLAHPDNARALEEIEAALFCLCLEDFAPADVQRACDELLHGDRGNRWFDKALSFVVFADGRAGVNIEHCELDGTTVLSFVDAVLGTPPAEHARRSGARTQGAPTPHPIHFTLDAAQRAQIRSAADSFAAYGAHTATRAVSFDDFGARDAKALRVSPDAFVQLAYQLAHQRAKGRLGTTYESIATRQYRRGRTEAMRVVTPRTLEFVAAMTDPAGDAPTRRAALRSAAEAHVARARECQVGRAPEQHLWELELIQRRRGPDLGVPEQPALYRSPGWRIMRDDYLSTSSAPSRHIQYFGFGSTSSRCVGVAYVLLPDRFHVYLSTPRPVADQMHAFADELRRAVAEMRELLAEPAGTR
ncbi:choline/carnitine O-acyltransferase [Streptomyces sp. NPDC057702]|uniref:choline/carnitine O-acyltransferase n=1 Tax=unclassified Streptomyces TaxID=2593676 RepID=UPI003691720E